MSDYNCECKPQYPNGMSAPVPPFWGFSAFTPTIPKLYWNVKSQEQRILNLFDLLNKLVCYADNIGQQVDVSADDIATIKKDLQTLKDGGLADLCEQQMRQWVKDNMRQVMAQSLRFAMFGINEDGRYVAYVPDSWADVMFDFGVVYGRSDYGRIKLLFDAEGNAINNLYDYTLAQPHDVAQLVADLEVTTSRGDATYDAVFTNMDAEVRQDGNQ